MRYKIGQRVEIAQRVLQLKVSGITKYGTGIDKPCYGEFKIKFDSVSTYFLRPNQIACAYPKKNSQLMFEFMYK